MSLYLQGYFFSHVSRLIQLLGKDLKLGSCRRIYLLVMSVQIWSMLT